MPSRIHTLLRQTRPFAGPEQEVFLTIQRLAGELAGGVAELLKPAGLSVAQYNVLRILRGAGERGRACGEVAERLITRGPDVTRLLDGLEKRGLVLRSRDAGDRRVVTARITPAGLELLSTLDEPLRELHLRQLGHLGPEKLAALLDLLDQAASAPV